MLCESCLSVFLAKIMGIYLMLVSLAVLLRHHQFKKNMGDFLGHHHLLALTGGLGILVGLLVVVSHNLWMSGWPVLITIIGWIVLLQGLCRLFCPDAFTRRSKQLMDHSGFLIWSWCWLIIGAYLTFQGFTNVGY